MGGHYRPTLVCSANTSKQSQTCCYRESMRSAFFVASLLIAHQTFAADTLPTLTELQKRGQESLARLAKSNAVWTVADLDKSGVGFRVDITHTPAGDRYDFRFVRPKKELLEIGRLITRKNVWFANFGKPQLARPNEVLFPHPALAMLLARTTLTPVSATGEGVVVESDDKSITFAGTLPPAKKAALEKLRLEVMQLPSSDGGHDKQVQQLERLDRMLKYGVPIKVSRSTGMILESGSEDHRLIVDDVEFISDDLGKWLAELPADAKPPAPPTQEELNRSVLFGFAPGWKPGMPESDLDLAMLDPKTDTVRRVPIRGGIANYGAFVSNHRKVVASVGQPNGTLVPVEIDLLTGANRPLAEDNLKSSISLFPVPSPDGSKVVVMSGLDGATSILQTQLWLIDLKSGASSRLGEPFDQAFVSWLPNGSGLILLSRYHDSPAGPERHVISRLSLKGERTDLLEGGNHPLLLGDGKTILFENDAREWNTCDLAGKNVKPFGTGFKGYGMPAVSPDGKSVLMNNYASGGPKPTVINLADFSETPLTQQVGLWAYPWWR